MKDYTNTFIINSLKLPVIYDLESLSNSIGISKKLIYVLSQHTNRYYQKFTIPKRNGTDRQIISPSYSLKLVQRWILKEILEKIEVFQEAMAFKKGTGIKQNAEFHKFSLYLLQLDLKDYFTSIKRERVFYLFKNLGYSNFVSNVLANLCTYKGYLPQGGVCSPYLSNLISFKLDRRLKGLSSKRDMLYTRYADDLTFSCDNKQTLKKTRHIIEDIIKEEGFTVNHTKTRFLSPISHKRVTGITINEQKIKASKQLKRKVRAMIHHAIISGDFSKNKIIRGYVSFINSIEEGYKNKIVDYVNSLILKDSKHYKEVVDAYNKNRIFKEASSMIFKGLEEINYIEDGYQEYYIDMDEKRYCFLKKRGYIKKEESFGRSESASTEDVF